MVTITVHEDCGNTPKKLFLYIASMEQNTTIFPLDILLLLIYNLTG